MNSQQALELLKAEVKPATGCTEPVAVALAVARAYRELGGTPQRVTIVLSVNVFKNAWAVGIPGIEKSGIDWAVGLGLGVEKEVLDLEILSELSAPEIERGKRFKNELPLQIDVDYSAPPVYIKARVETEKGNAVAIMKDKHDNLVYLEKNGESLLERRGEEEKSSGEIIKRLNFQELISLVGEISYEEGRFLLEGSDLNLAMAEKGWEIKNGMGFVRGWKKAEQKGYIQKDMNSLITGYTVAAAEARMAGISMPVMTSAGSGNHGLVAIIPAAIFAREQKVKKMETIRGLALSHLITIYVKSYTGRLSSVCGCAIAAGSGATAALTYLMGGNPQQIEMAVKNVISSLAGMVCDGGKVGCAIKLCSIAATVWYSALLAVENSVVPEGNGIIGKDMRTTLENLEVLTEQGMEKMDQTIVEIMNRSG